ncbi:MAG: SDR family oxidoreductase [Brevinema sp.]
MKPLVVITGASSGIGMECAKKFSELGHPLLLLARRINLLDDLNLPNTICRKVDVSCKDSVDASIREAEETYGKTDLIINNAGVMLLGHSLSQDIEEWDQMVDVDLKGVLYGAYAVLKDMAARRHGTIINIGSTAGRKNSPTRAVYNAVKFAVHAFSETLRMELAGSGVRVSVIAPGVVDTELVSHTSSPEIVANYKEMRSHFNGGLKPKDIADAIAYTYNLPQHICIREIVIAHTEQQA